MKYIILVLSLFVLSCSPKSVTQNNNSIKAKIVRLSCASAVIQILDKNYYHLTEDWTVFGTSRKVQNAVSVSNKCDIPKDLKEGDEFYFQLAKQEEINLNCITCMMMDYPPEKRIFIKLK